MIERDENRMSGERLMENSIEETKTRESREYFWHTYYGFPSEMLGWVLLVVSLLFIAFVISLALGIL
jgi:hypothetical protein